MSGKKFPFALAILVVLAGGSYFLLYLSPDMGEDSDGHIRVYNEKTQSLNVTLKTRYAGNDTRVWTKEFTLGPGHDTRFEWPAMPNEDYRMIVIADGDRSDPYEFSSGKDEYNSQLWIHIQKDGNFEFSTVID